MSSNPRHLRPEYTLMLRYMSSGPMCSADVGVELGITIRNARYYTSTAHQRGDVHIQSWAKRERGPWYPIYSRGPGTDAKAPNLISHEERLLKNRIAAKKRRKDVEVWLNSRNRKRAARLKAKGYNLEELEKDNPYTVWEREINVS